MGGLLDGNPDAGRERTVTVVHETSAKRRFEMRCAQDAAYGYIWNAWSDGATAYQAENMGGRSWPAMTEAAATDQTIADRRRFYLNRVPEELYDLRTDPHALVNLADDPGHRAPLAELRSHLATWMADVADPLATDFTLGQ